MIELLPLRKEDCGNILDWNADKDAGFLRLWSGNFYKYPITEEQIVERINNYKSPQYDIHIFKIVLKETNRMIGTIELLTKESDFENSSVGRFLFDKEYRNKGYGQIALKEICNIALNIMNRKRVVLGVFENNINAIKCYEKVGFKKTKFNENKDDIKWNGYEMVLLKDEFEYNNL